MTHEQMRVEIAKACPNLFVLRGSIVEWKKGQEGEDLDIDPVNDLNAMHEAEKTLTDEQWPVYVEHLHEAAWKVVKNLRPLPWMRREACTAAQRAEAFCRVKGLWKDA